MLSFGLPAHIADIHATWLVWVIGPAHTTAIGLQIFIFYFCRQLDIVDIIVGLSSSYAALVDSCILYIQVDIPGFYSPCADRFLRYLGIDWNDIEPLATYL
jgi:hypothetical protein